MTTPAKTADLRNTVPKRTLSVRVRLMLVVVIALLPLLVERIHNEQIDRNDRVEAAYKQALSLARQGAATQSEMLASLRGILQSVAGARATFRFSDTACNEYLKNVAKPIAWIQAISVADLQGRILCSSFDKAIGLDISQRAHFINALKARDFVLSDYIMGTRAEIPIITGALPQTGVNGAPDAVVLGVIDLHWFGRIAHDFVAPDGSLLMIDRNGTVLANYPDDRTLVGRSFKDQPLIRQMLTNSSGLVTEVSLDGVRRIFGFVQLPDTQARFAVGFDEGKILGRANRAMWTALSELGAMALLVLIGIWVGGERLLVRPIRRLALAASQIGHGEVTSSATSLPLTAEFIPLAVALDDMAEKLNARERELRDLNSQLHELAHTDALTGLANRRTFNAKLATEWEVAIQRHQPVAVLMIDVDFFKRFNDHYGHVQGDACLRKVAAILNGGIRSDRGVPLSSARDPGELRKPDFIARYGGEEFAVLLQGATLEGAVETGERLRKAVENMLMAHVGAAWGFVSISIGAAAMVPSSTLSSRVLVENADEALYEAKRRGRNMVVAHATLRLVKAPLLQAH